MSFARELRVIPRTARIIAFACYAIFAICLFFLIIPTDNEPGGIATWPLAGQLAFTLLIPLFLLGIVAFWGYIYGDAKRRGMRPVMWTLLVIFVPYAIGIILYFILRDPLPAECPACHTLVLAKFAFCPHCGTGVRSSCPQCGRTLESGWVNCGYCGTRLPAQQRP